MGFSELTMVRAVKKQKYVIPSPDFEQTKFCEKKDKKTKTKVEKKKSDGYSIICLFRVLFFFVFVLVFLSSIYSCGFSPKIHVI
jgi:hypothetical protein